MRCWIYIESCLHDFNATIVFLVCVTMRIMFVISDLKSGGTQRVLSLVSKELIARKYEVCLVTLSGSASDFYEVDPRIKRIALNLQVASSGFFDAVYMSFKRICGLRRSYQDCRPDVVFSFLPSVNALAVLAAVALNIRLVVSERNNISKQKISIIWSVSRRCLYPFADYVTYNSKNSYQDLRKFVKEDRLVYLPNPINITASHAKLSIERPFILCVGRLHYQKAYDVLIEAFVDVVKCYPEWKLFIAGVGDLENDLKRLSIDLGVSANVCWLGEVDDIERYYEAAQIYVLASRYEGTPNSLLEAMFFGLPCVITDEIQGSDECFVDNKTCVVIPVEDPEKLSEAIKLLIKSPSIRKDIGLEARKQVDKFRIEKVIDKWEEIINTPPRLR